MFSREGFSRTPRLQGTERSLAVVVGFHCHMTIITVPVIRYTRALSIPLVPYTPTLRHIGGPFVFIGWIRTANANLEVLSSFGEELLPSTGAIVNT